MFHLRANALLAVLLLCAAPIAGSSHAWADEPGDSAAPIPTDKLDHYVKGYNFLVGTFGLTAQYQLYASQQIARKTVDDPVNVSDGWLDQGDDELTQGYSANGGAGWTAVDVQAGQMIPILDRLVERLKGLESYYTSRGPLEDNFARGKREDPLVMADFKAALAALPPLKAALDVAIDRRDTADLLALQAQGDQIGFSGGIALQEAKKLVALLRPPQAIRNPQILAQTDTLADAIVQALSDEHTALDAAKASGDDSNALRNSNYGMAAGQLQSMVGAYRELKHTGNPAEYQAIVWSYNAAIESVNIGQ